MSKVATRFAPSPTGPLHIGGVRTALFNWLFSKNQKGTFHLRIEDTDKERSKDEYKDQIIESLKWIGIEHDGDEYIQSTKINDHINVVNELIESGNAYKCYCSNEEIEEQKKRAKQKKLPYIYNRKCRDLDEKDAPKDINPVIRFKSKIEGNSVLKDLVQGEVKIDNITIEDFIILRKDKTPTYNLSVSVDDHQMNMTHIIRGDDHKINTFKQMQIYFAMKWNLPAFAHIPLIHTTEGKKLSKEEENIAKKFWDEVSKNIPEWQLLLEKKITPIELRKEFVHSTTNSLNALGIVGRIILQKYPENWKEKLRGLKDINWSRNNSEWEGRLLLNGRMLKTTLGVELAANTILKKCGIPLSEDRLKHENRS